MKIGYLTVTRITKDEEGTFGALEIGRKRTRPFCVTLEPEDKDNKVGISCIPAGTYVCERYGSAKYPDTWQIMDVPDRTHILFHAGNTENASRGCVILAAYYGKLKGKWAILNSGATFKKFMDETRKYDLLMLTIKECI